MYKFKNELKNFRQQKGLTISDVAYRIGITDKTYSDYEKGLNSPRVETLLKLVDVFEIEMSDLFEGYDKPKEKRPSYEMSDLILEIDDGRYLKVRKYLDNEEVIVDLLTNVTKHN